MSILSILMSPDVWQAVFGLMELLLDVWAIMEAQQVRKEDRKNRDQ